MMTNQVPQKPSKIHTEPAGFAELVRVLVALGVGAGWITNQEANGLTVGLTGLGVLVSVLLTWWTRRKVTPAARPRTADGTALVPAPPPTRLAE